MTGPGWAEAPERMSAVRQPPDPAIEETFALAAHLVGYAVGLVEQVSPGHGAARRLRDGINALEATPGFRCTDCGQIRPADDFTLIPTGEGGRQQPCSSCCDARAANRLGPDAQGSR